jgi:hypothetical protein
MRARPLTELHAARRGLLVPATVIAEVGYFLAREAGARVESLSYGPVAGGDFAPVDLTSTDRADSPPSEYVWKLTGAGREGTCRLECGGMRLKLRVRRRPAWPGAGFCAVSWLVVPGLPGF